MLRQPADAPKEAHLLSVIYALLGYELATANRFIRRMWTNFQHNNLRTSDEARSPSGTCHARRGAGQDPREDRTMM
jgi:hypothetical protein